MKSTKKLLSSFFYTYTDEQGATIDPPCGDDDCFTGSFLSVSGDATSPGWGSILAARPLADGPFEELSGDAKFTTFYPPENMVGLGYGLSGPNIPIGHVSFVVTDDERVNYCYQIKRENEKVMWEDFKVECWKGETAGPSFEPEFGILEYSWSVFTSAGEFEFSVSSLTAEVSE